MSKNEYTEWILQPSGLWWGVTVYRAAYGRVWREEMPEHPSLAELSRMLLDYREAVKLGVIGPDIMRYYCEPEAAR
jgi:hypothetical protein